MMSGLKFKNCGQHSGLLSNKAVDTIVTPAQSTNSCRIYPTANPQPNVDLSTNPNNGQLNSDNSDGKTISRARIETDFLSNNERSKYLLESGHMNDICFIVEDEKKDERIHCHKLILATRSRVFNKSFYGPNADKSTEIKINDVKAKDFRNLLRYIYYDDTNLAIQTFCSTFVAAEKYALKTMVKALINKVKYFDGNDVCLMLRQLECCKINNKELQRELSKTFQIETKKIIVSSEFVHLGSETLRDLISSQILNVKEIDLFNAVLKWAKSRCIEQQIVINPLNLKKVISRFIYMFRYKSMDLSSFASGPGLLKILNDSETVDVFLHFTLKENSMIPKQLIQSERLLPTTYDVKFISVLIGMADKITDQKYETIEFQADHEIYLKGVIIGRGNFVGEVESVEADISLSKVLKNEKYQVLSKTRMVPSDYDDCDSCIEYPFKRVVEFDYPVLIEPNVEYRILLMLPQPGPCSYMSCESTASSVNVEFEFKARYGLCLLHSLIFNKFQ